MKRSFSALLFLCALFIIGSCQENKVYDHYEHTPLSGWEKNDSLFFEIPKSETDAYYAVALGLRLHSTYPFQSLTLIVKQTVYPQRGGEQKGRPTHPVHIVGKVYVDTLNCPLISSTGRTTGKGIGSFQYQFPVTELHLNQGDSVHVCVSHDMKQEILPGISDIGITYTRE